MLRYKPEQPLRMTMMIRDRRRARIRRVQRWDEVQEMKHLAEVEAEAAPTPFLITRPRGAHTIYQPKCTCKHNFDASANARA